MNIKDLFKIIYAAGEDAVLATIVSETGSSPRSAGAHLLITGAGRVGGTIGGGPVEYAAIQDAGALLKRRTSARKTYRLRPDGGAELGMLCGGDVDLFFQFISKDDAPAMTLLKDACVRLEAYAEKLWLLIDITSAPKMALYGPAVPLSGIDLSAESLKNLTKHKPVLLETGTRCIYGEPINAPGRVFIFGAGHVAQALEPVLSRIGFRCVVLDTRREFLTPELFSKAAVLLPVDYEHIDTPITPDDYLIVMTHNADLPVVRGLISHTSAYLGLIGSKTKVAAIKDHLRREGVGEEKLNAMNAPIGIKIRSETPEEIAISIAAELIQRRAERREGGRI